MPIQVTCSSCNATLKTADSSAGKRAKCPKCGGIIEIPALASPESDDEYELEDAANPLTGFSDEEISAGAPTGDDRKPCPACGEMISRKAIKCRFCGEVLDKSMKGVLASPGNVSDPAWQKVRGGLATLYYSIVIMFIAFIFLMVGGMVAGAMGAAGGEAEMGGPMLIVIMIGGLAILGAAIGVIVGQVRCSAVPEASGARGFAIGAAICILANVALSMVGGAIQSQGLTGIGNLASMVGYILFILFIRRAADYLGNQDLASSAGRFLIFGIFMFLGVIVCIGLAAAQSMALVGVTALVLIVAALVAFVWYMRLIKSLMDTIDRRQPA